MEPVQIEVKNAASLPILAEGAKDVSVLAVWSNDKYIYYGYLLRSSVYKEIIKFSYKVLYLGLSRRYLSLWMIGYFQTGSEIPIQGQRFYIDENNYQESTMKTDSALIPKWKLLLQHNFQHFKIPLDSLLSEDTQINNMLNIMLKVDGLELDYRLGKKFRNRLANIRHYYAPYKSRYLKDFAVHVRRTDRGNFSIVKRPKEEVEKRLWFKIMESRGISWLLYHLGKWRGEKCEPVL